MGARSGARRRRKRRGERVDLSRPASVRLGLDPRRDERGPRRRCCEFPTASCIVRAKHPKKQVEAALKEAEEVDFRVESGRGHWGVIYCPGIREGKCPPFSVNGSPKNADNEGKRIRRFVARCPHKQT